MTDDKVIFILIFISGERFSACCEIIFRISRYVDLPFSFLMIPEMADLHYLFINLFHLLSIIKIQALNLFDCL